MKKKIKIGGIVIAGLLILNVVLVLLEGVSFDYWRRLGFPNAVTIFTYKADEYPGHSLECIRFPKKLMANKKDKEILEYTKGGTGIDSNGYSVHIGDLRKHVIDQFKYIDPDGDGSEYELGCYFCETGYFLTITFLYDAEDKVTDISIQKNCY